METVTAAQLSESFDKTQFTLVDIYADWCAPCKRMTPVVEALSQEFTFVNFVKVDADADSEYSVAAGVRSIPTLIMYATDGEELDRWTGNQDVSAIRDWITETLQHDIAGTN